MGLYERFLLPWIVHFACSSKPTRRQREKVVPLAHGAVLEVGFGSGLNLPFYDRRRVEQVMALEPSREMWGLAEERVRAVGFPVEHLPAPAEEIPLADRSVDTVLLTYTMCTLPDVEGALAEMRRVLRPGGEIVFCEHGAAPDEDVRRWQRRINPLWKRVGGGCNLDRPIPSLLERGGLRVAELSSMYIPGWRPASFNYWGRAVAGAGAEDSRREGVRASGS